MITLGVDLHAREARLIVLDTDSGTPSIAHAGTLSFPEGFLADVMSNHPQPLVHALQDQINIWGLRPSACAFTASLALMQHPRVTEALITCGQALGVKRHPLLTEPLPAIMAALQYEARPCITILVHEGITEVVGLGEAGELIHGSPCPTPLDQLALEIWTPETPGPALSVWLSDVVRRVERLSAQMEASPSGDKARGGGPSSLPVVVLADQVAFPFLVDLLAHRLSFPVKWPTPWTAFKTGEASPAFLTLMGPLLIPALGTALLSAKTRDAETTVRKESPRNRAAATTRPFSLTSILALGSLLLWWPLLAWLNTEHAQLAQAIIQTQVTVEQRRNDVTRLEGLEAFVQQTEASQGPAPVGSALKPMLNILPSSLYITRFDLRREALGGAGSPEVRVFAQGLTRKPDDVKKWIAHIERLGIFQAEPPNFQAIKPRTRFHVVFKSKSPPSP